jgi:8-oxo-dGTP pyrophosphatase MutT (NUDIX family)
LVEEGEATEAGLFECAARELEEELGFTVAPAAFQKLGASMYPSPGLCAERHFYFAVEVDPKRRAEPGLDGSALERDGQVIARPLLEVLAACRNGDIEDSKTELGARRLLEL